MRSMAPLRATVLLSARNGAVMLIISFLVLVGCVESASAHGIVRSPTSVSQPPKIHVTVSAGIHKTDAVIASPLLVQYDGSRLISKTYRMGDPSILKVSGQDNSLEVSAPALPQFVQIESAKSISKNGDLIGKSVITQCGPAPALDLLSHCTHGHETSGRWKWKISIAAARFRSPYLIVYVRWISNRKKGSPVIYLGLWSLLVQRHGQNTGTYGG